MKKRKVSTLFHAVDAGLQSFFKSALWKHRKNIMKIVFYVLKVVGKLIDS